VTMSMDLPPFMEARESAPAEAGAARRLVWPLGRNYGARWAPLRHDGGSSFDQLAGAGPVAGFRAARGGRSKNGNEGSEDVDLASGPSPQDRAAQVPVPHANRPAAAIHSSRPSMGIR
jgi:hypothetical protein